MGATTFYGLPYPDATSSVDVPRDIKALADRLELWKNGFTIPNGNLILNTNGDATSREIYIRRFTAGVQYEFRQRSGGASYIVQAYANGVLERSLEFFNNGQLRVSDPTTARPLPFAHWADQKTVNLSNEIFKAITVNFAAGLFTANPVCVATVQNSTIYFGYVASLTTASVSIGASHRDATATTVSLPVMMIAIQSAVTTGPSALVSRGEPSTVEFDYERYGICRTDDCPNNGIPIGEVGDVTDAVYCGPCGEPVTEFDE